LGGVPGVRMDAGLLLWKKAGPSVAASPAWQ
jgi:hypothetical protein